MTIDQQTRTATVDGHTAERLSHAPQLAIATVRLAGTLEDKLAAAAAPRAARPVGAEP